MRRLALLCGLLLLANCAGTLPIPEEPIPGETFRVFPPDGPPRDRAEIELGCVPVVQPDDQTPGRYVASCYDQRVVYDCELVAAGNEQCRRIE